MIDELLKAERFVYPNLTCMQLTYAKRDIRGLAIYPLPLFRDIDPASVAEALSAQ